MLGKWGEAKGGLCHASLTRIGVRRTDTRNEDSRRLELGLKVMFFCLPPGDDFCPESGEEVMGVAKRCGISHRSCTWTL